MPRKLNPGELKTGHGKAAPDVAVDRPRLTGTGLAGPGPNIGTIEQPAQVTAETANLSVIQGHMDGPGAHKASAITTDGAPSLLWSSTVEGALDELIGAVMQRPPMLGQSNTGPFHGIPDWGYLKLRDGGLTNYRGATEDGAVDLIPWDSSQVESAIYPYLLQEVGPSIDKEFGIKMSDPWVDWTFNTGMERLGLPGAGYGRTHIGAFTRGGDVGGPLPLPITRTARLYPRYTATDKSTKRPYRVPVTVSGTIFPADRGVLALLHFLPDTGGDLKATFLAQPLISDHTAPLSTPGRVVAALLLGNGILGVQCSEGQPCDVGQACDGSPGGIFSPGVAKDGSFDPFAFPGYATGQYDLAEIHQGVNSDGNPLKAPWDDLDGDTVAGVDRGALDVTPAPGQVRLGTDPEAGETPVNYGIPILGGTYWYGVFPSDQPGSLGYAIHGDALVTGSNFFRYRLPALKDYSSATGLKWTPRGENAEVSFETKRYFDRASGSNTTVYADGSAVGSVWRSAGLFDNFDEDYWPWQVARYRQTFLMQSIAPTWDRQEIGSYLLIHFKTEADFERCVRDGEFPWDMADPYEVYGITLATHPEDEGEVANPWLEVDAPEPPDGPAPLYGYAANPYHPLRGLIFQDPVGKSMPAVTDSALSWITDSVPGDEHVTWISGVAYFTSRRVDNGNQSLVVVQCEISLGAGFWTSYRTDSNDYIAGTGPARVASQDPVMLATAPWGYASYAGFESSLLIPVSPNPLVGLVPTTDYQRQWRIDVPFTHLGNNGSGAFSDTNAPRDADALTLISPNNIVLLGDDAYPSFSRKAQMRGHFRRPLNHINPNDLNRPFSLTNGHGAVFFMPQGPTLLLHTTRWDAFNQTGEYGNFVVNIPGAPPNLGYASLHQPLKDYHEKFLDEVARFTSQFSAGINGWGPYTLDAVDALNGPGMGGWAGGPIEVPVRISLATVPWDGYSWLLMERHLEDISKDSRPLMVAGLPDRNPKISDMALMPFPSCGVLQYPQGDFTLGAGVSPNSLNHIVEPQRDYSGLTGLRSYTRCFDAAFSHLALSPFSILVAGETELTLRFDGITLEDFAYTAPGPGGVEDNRISIALKVPGLTTWMDVGRQDGAGPSKQDPNLDGAGCMIVGDETYNFVDPESGYVGCYVRVHVGPVATLFENPGLFSGYTVGLTQGESPVLVQVQMRETAYAYNLEEIATGVGTFEGISKPGASPSQVRGIIGIRIVHPNETLLSPYVVGGGGP